MIPRAARTCLALAAFAVAAFTGVSCAAVGDRDEPEPPRFGDEFASAPGARPFASLGVADEIRDLVLRSYPAARTAEYGGVLLPLGDALIVTEESPDVDARLRAVGLEVGWAELPAEGYVLAVTWEAGRTVVLSCARDEAGHRWASATLSQITWREDGKTWLRACRILDAPLFPLRGNKRPQEWETSYRANFAWEARKAPGFAGRTLVATAAPGSPFDATPRSLQNQLDAWKPWQDEGVTRFCLKFDDVGFALTSEAWDWHGTYPKAIVSYVRDLRAGLRRRDERAVLYLLPQTYWWRDRRLASFADAIRAAGGLPEDIGIVMTGPEIISETIDAEGLAAARHAFGATRTPALIYDNLGREGDWGPLTGRDARLVAECEAVFGERGTPVNRLTRLDWLWNAQDYDAEWSWRRAILDLAGPRAFGEFRAVCSAFRAGADREDAEKLIAAFEHAGGGPAADAGPLPKRELVALLRSDLRHLSTRAEIAAAAAAAARADAAPGASDR